MMVRFCNQVFSFSFSHALHLFLSLFFLSLSFRFFCVLLAMGRCRLCVVTRRSSVDVRSVFCGRQRDRAPGQRRFLFRALHAQSCIFLPVAHPCGLCRLCHLFSVASSFSFALVCLAFPVFSALCSPCLFSFFLFLLSSFSSFTLPSLLPSLFAFSPFLLSLPLPSPSSFALPHLSPLLLLLLFFTPFPYFPSFSFLTSPPSRASLTTSPFSFFFPLPRLSPLLSFSSSSLLFLISLLSPF